MNVIFLAMGLCFAAQTPNAPGKPNVILIVADDLGWADLGCYGSKFHRTPNLDRMASQGTRFTNAYAACPVCSPTRAALMTGRYPARLRLTDWLPGRPNRPDQALSRPAFRQELPLEEVTVAESLRELGYKTAHMGKWHLGGEGFEPTKQGFDLNIAGDHTGTPLSYFAPFQNKNAQGQVRMMPGLENAKPNEYLTDRLTDEAVNFIKQNSKQPFFLYLPHYTVHTPLKAKAEKIAHYSSKMIPGQQSNAIYAAMLESLDDSVGRLLETLKDQKILENTMVIFTSDNGGLATAEGPNTPSTNNSPLREGKGYLYEGGVRVPLIIRWPGSSVELVNSTPVSSIDLMPTILEECGTKPKTCDGLSISQLGRGQSKSLARDSLYWHYPHYANQGGKPGGAIRWKQFKLIEFYEDEKRELFDLQADPRESRNLAQERPELVKQMATQLDQWRKEVQAQSMKPFEGYVPNPQGKDGSITLHAKSARVYGTQLRFEPLPHKNTLGYWVNEKDHAQWEFTISKTGAFQVEMLQGCGTGQGGSVVEVTIAGQTLSMTVEDTGHFQNFKPRIIGQVQIDQVGKQTLIVKPKTKAKAAVMDLRQVVLKPVPMPQPKQNAPLR